ncbi:hypothetical protein HDF12_001459 [Edaphobacter lichenicola]|uniref:Uncharacterized protein n=1 Tax=Tunturiibacter lichenicola TaxID=2051959 RepID=A0A7Y9NKL7_9BACT|nr:hypothetical protein [Edaphobacter lichenicola]
MSEAFAAEQFEKSLSMTPSQVCVGLAFGRVVAKMTPSLDHLLR